MLTVKEFKAMSVGYDRLCKAFSAAGVRPPTVEDLESESAFSMLQEMSLNDIFATHSPAPISNELKFKPWNPEQGYKEEVK